MTGEVIDPHVAINSLRIAIKKAVGTLKNIQQNQNAIIMDVLIPLKEDLRAIFKPIADMKM